MGEDKARLDWEGAPLWKVQASKLSALSPKRLLVSFRGEQALEVGEVYGEAVLDPPDNPGPLGAIVRCLELAEMPLLVLAVDMPGMTPEFLRELLVEWRDEETGLVCRAAHGFEPLAAIYPQRALPLLRNQLAMRNYRMQAALSFLAAEGIVRVRALRRDEVPLFNNANTPEEYAAWKTSAPPASA